MTRYSSAACLAVLLLFGHLLAAQTEAPLTLREDEPQVWDFQPAVTFFPPALCGEHGRIFLHVGAPSNRWHSTVWRIEPHDQKRIEYRLPAELAREFTFDAFTVSPSGEVLVAYHAGKEKRVWIVRFDEKGELSTRFRLETPPHFVPSSLGAFADGALLLTGYFDDEVEIKRRNRPYVAVFRDNGLLVREISTRLPDATLEPARREQEAATGMTVSALDGNIYQLRGTRILVIDSSGRIRRSFDVQKPSLAHEPLFLRLSGGVLSVEFAIAKLSSAASDLYFSTYDAATGEHRHDYVPEKQLGNASLCFSEVEGITFFRPKNGKFGVVTASVH